MGKFRETQCFLIVLVVLDPRYKLDYVNSKISQLYDDDVAFMIQCKLKVALYGMYDEYRK